MSPFVPAHLVREHSIHLALAPVAAFPLFTAEGERRWAPGWDPRILHPAGGATCPGAVFVTDADGPLETVWWVADLDPQAGLARYVRLTPGSRLAIVEVRLAATPDGGTTATVRYEFTALSPEGNAYVAQMTPENYRAMIDGWEQEIGAALAREGDRS